MDTYALTLTLETLMKGHDPKAPKPDPMEGESVIDYWLRVVQYQAWENGVAAGAEYESRRVSEDPEDWRGLVLPVNPYSKED